MRMLSLKFALSTLGMLAIPFIFAFFPSRKVDGCITAQDCVGNSWAGCTCPDSGCKGCLSIKSGILGCGRCLMQGIRRGSRMMKVIRLFIIGFIIARFAFAQSTAVWKFKSGTRTAMLLSALLLS